MSLANPAASIYKGAQGVGSGPSTPGSASERDSLPVVTSPAAKRWHGHNPLIGAHVSREFKARLDALSEVTGITKNDLIVEGLRLVFAARREKDAQLDRGEVTP